MYGADGRMEQTVDAKVPRRRAVSGRRCAWLGLWVLIWRSRDAVERANHYLRIPARRTYFVSAEVDAGGREERELGLQGSKGCFLLAVPCNISRILIVDSSGLLIEAVVKSPLH